MIRQYLGLGTLISMSACGSGASVAPPDIAIGDGTEITGTIGSLGSAQPTVSSLMISNSGETLIYLSSGMLTCDQLTVSRWLGGTATGTQVIEFVFEGAPATGTLDVPPAEINFAPGGMSSSHEVSASSGVISFESAEATSMVAGTFDARQGSDEFSGFFHATFCANGQGY